MVVLVDQIDEHRMMSRLLEHSNHSSFETLFNFSLTGILSDSNDFNYVLLLWCPCKNCRAFKRRSFLILHILANGKDSFGRSDTIHDLHLNVHDDKLDP